MSSFLKVQTQITDQDLLAEALTAMGYANVESHSQAQKLVNRWGDSHGVSIAEVVVRSKDAAQKHAGYNLSDFGFKRDTNGMFALQANDMDRRNYNDAWLAELQANVGIAKATRLARRTYGCARPQIHDIETADGPKRVVKFVIPSNV
jgi:hypothetical protein